MSCVAGSQSSRPPWPSSIVELLFCPRQENCEDFWGLEDKQREGGIVSLVYPSSSASDVKDSDETLQAASTDERQTAASPEENRAQSPRQVSRFSLPPASDISSQPHLPSGAHPNMPLTSSCGRKTGDDPKGEVPLESGVGDDPEGRLFCKKDAASLSPSHEGRGEQPKGRAPPKSFAELLELSLAKKRWLCGGAGGTNTSGDLSECPNEAATTLQSTSRELQGKRESGKSKERPDESDGVARANNVLGRLTMQQGNETESVSRQDEGLVAEPTEKELGGRGREETDVANSEKERASTDRAIVEEEARGWGSEVTGRGPEIRVEGSGGSTEKASAAESGGKASCKKSLESGQEKEDVLPDAARTKRNSGATREKVRKGTWSLPLVLLVYANIHTEADLAVWRRQQGGEGGQAEASRGSGVKASGGEARETAEEEEEAEDPRQRSGVSEEQEESRKEQCGTTVRERQGEAPGAAAADRRKEATRSVLASSRTASSARSTAPPFLSADIWIRAPSDPCKDVSLLRTQALPRCARSTELRDSGAAGRTVQSDRLFFAACPGLVTVSGLSLLLLSV